MLQRCSRVQGQGGVALLETLISAVVLTLVGTALLASIITSIRSSVVHREAANAEVVARNFVDAVEGAPYVPCASAASYANPPSFAAMPGYSVQIDEVEFLVPGSDPSTFGSSCDPVAGSGLPDTGLQRVSFQVMVDRGSGPEPVRSQSTLKRYEANVDNTLGAVPGGGVRCTVTASQDASLTQASPNQADGSSVSMSVNGASGSRTRSVVKVALVPGSTPCAEGGTVPVNMQVRSATLRLFTWQVSGAVDCATSCWHVLKRVTAPWNESSVTWATSPPVLTAGHELFQHGTGTGDFGPRYQNITGNGLTQDVASFYAVPSVNHGWTIDHACEPDYPGRGCGTADTAFRMRTREWSNPEQRPQLSVVFGPSLTSQRQIRNVAFGTCASVLDNQASNGGSVVAQTCAGKGWQAWSFDALNRFVALNTVDNCMETGNAANGMPDVFTWDCDGPDGGVHDPWQMWVIDGSEIQYQPDRTKCIEIRDGNQAIGTRLTIDRCLGTAGNGLSNGRAVVDWTCNADTPWGGTSTRTG